jgi:hypothetical protein
VFQDQPPDPRVIGRVGVHESLCEIEVGEDRQLLAILGRQVVHRPGEPALVGVARDVEIRLHDVVIAGDDPAAERRAPVDGILLAQAAKGRIGIGHEGGGDEELVEGLLVHQVGWHACAPPVSDGLVPILPAGLPARWGRLTAERCLYDREWEAGDTR